MQEVGDVEEEEREELGNKKKTASRGQPARQAVAKSTKQKKKQGNK
jgi:hypothetical protein